MQGFHITHKSNVSSIQSDGIIANQSGTWREQRRQFRQEIDSFIGSVKTGWVQREGAVFFWSTISDAEDNIRMVTDNRQDYVVVGVDLSSSDVWAVDNQLIEQLFEQWQQTSTISERDLNALKNDVSMWDGDTKARTELWCQSPVAPSNIMEIQ